MGLALPSDDLAGLSCDDFKCHAIEILLEQGVAQVVMACQFVCASVELT
ncbi:MAG: hypothetical protein ABF542_11685 [Gluconobacter sp.]